MLNPRDVYLQACAQLGKDPGLDYFVYRHPLEEGRADKKLVKNLKKFVSDKKTDVNGLQKAAEIFREWNNRLFIEGLLTYFKVDELATIPGMSTETLNAYTTYFFSTTDLTDFSGRSVFITTINNPSAKRWFEQCSIREIEDIRYRLTGETRKDDEITKTLKRVFFKVASTCETFMTIKPSSLQKMEHGMSAEQKNLFDIGLKSGVLMAKIGDVLQKYPDQDKDDFIASWSLEVLSDDPSVFDTQLPPDQEAELQLLVNEISPIKVAKDSLTENDLMADDMD